MLNSVSPRWTMYGTQPGRPAHCGVGNVWTTGVTVTNVGKGVAVAVSVAVGVSVGVTVGVAVGVLVSVLVGVWVAV